MQTPTNHGNVDNHAQSQKSAAISGSSGLIGSAMLPMLATSGYRVRRLVRGHPDTDLGELPLPVGSQDVDPRGFEGLDAVIHLAAESIIARRWSNEQKERLRTSRVETTRRLCELLARLERPPRVLVCASAVGIYGSRGDEILDEKSSAGEGFLADVCSQWEATTDAAQQRGIRVVLARFGIVLSPRGGALAKMLRPFQFGLGGALGDGRQYWSWISIDDAASAVGCALVDDRLEGPVNMVSPEPVTSRQFAKTLARVLHRPALCRVPRIALRTMLGRELADETLLSSTRVVPGRLTETGYPYHHPTLETALRQLLGLEVERFDP